MEKPSTKIPVGPAAGEAQSRRSWLSRAAWVTAACGVGCVVDAFFVEPHWLEIVERDLPIAKLPSQLAGCTLAQISDMHIGYQVSEAYLVASFARVAALRPDIVVMTGDFISLDRDGTAPLAAVERICQTFPRGRLATLSIFGNHDYGRGFVDASAADRLVQALGKSDLRVLRNETASVAGLQLIGIDDLWSGQIDIRAALANSDAQAARLVLCHNPDAADLPDWGDYQGWILAGHTHGGQCKPPFLPPPMLPVRNRRYTAGEIDLHDGRSLYINRGLGHLLGVRFNVRPEVTLFRLVPT